MQIERSDGKPPVPIQPQTAKSDEKTGVCRQPSARNHYGTMEHWRLAGGFRAASGWPKMAGMGQPWADYRVFWREFRRSFETTGAILPSGPALAAALCRHVRDGNVGQEGGRRILEVGPGTGAVTRHILRALRADDQLDLVERNAEFVACLRDRIAKDADYRAAAGRVTLYHASVEEISDAPPYDVIVSGLPLNNFPIELVTRLLEKLQRLLAPGGTLSFFEYIAIRRVKTLLSNRSERQRLSGIGKTLGSILASHEVGRDCVIANVPPAWVHHVRFQ
jgi:phosphatidylethanolamine/phosphatidyl-N-methylethanolamine N-methyltransferase